MGRGRAQERSGAEGACGCGGWGIVSPGAGSPQEGAPDLPPRVSCQAAFGAGVLPGAGRGGLCEHDGEQPGGRFLEDSRDPAGRRRGKAWFNSCSWDVVG